MPKLYEEIKEEFGKPEAARSFLARIGSLGDNLTHGLAKLEASQIDVDKLDEHLRKPIRAPR